jgi:hypothetical protein
MFMFGQSISVTGRKKRRRRETPMNSQKAISGEYSVGDIPKVRFMQLNL